MYSRITELDRKYILAGIGFGTFFFGFAAGAVASFYLLSIHSGLVANLRTSLNFKSAIFGDGILLPVVNMIAASFLINNIRRIRKKTVRNAFLTGLLVTVYFNVNQAINGLVNWSMPTPWHWNILGLWHAIYMFSVCSFLALFYFVTFRYVKTTKKVPYEMYAVTFGLIFFLMLLHLDYASVTLGNVVLH